MDRRSSTHILTQVQNLMLTMPDVLHFESFDKRRKEFIRISELCKKDPLYKKTESTRAAFYQPLKNVSIEKAVIMSWVHLLDRMQKAPSTDKLKGAVILCFPVIGDLLKGRR